MIKRNLLRTATHRAYHAMDEDPLPPPVQNQPTDKEPNENSLDSQYIDYTPKSIQTLAGDLSTTPTFPSFQMICLALKGKPINVEHHIYEPSDGCFYRLRKLISAGYFTNSITLGKPGKTSVIPRLSLLLIYSRYLVGLQQVLGNPDIMPTEEILEKNRFYNLLQMFDLFSPNTKAISAGTLGDWYQSFHSCWEASYRVAFAEDQEVAPSLVEQFYRGPINTQIENGHEGLIYGEDTKIVLTPSSKEPINHVVDVTNAADFESTLKTGRGFNKIFVLGKTNPGFDILIVEKSPPHGRSSSDKEKPILILIECKSRFPESATSQLDEKSCRSKIRNTVTEFFLNYKGSHPHFLPDSVSTFFIFTSFFLLSLTLIDVFKKRETKREISPREFLVC